jgi:hypothetical protein
MLAHERPTPPLRDQDFEVIAYLAGRSAPCPRCAYDLRDNTTANCPECGEPLILKVGSPRATFGWFLLSIAPGCFSGIAAAFILIPLTFNFIANFPTPVGIPWPLIAAEAFGFVSIASVWFMYRHRHRLLARPHKRQAWFAFGIWGIHAAALGLFILAMWLWQ